MKYEIAGEFGYLDVVLSTGWKSLTEKNGRIGGLIAQKKEQKQ